MNQRKAVFLAFLFVFHSFYGVIPHANHPLVPDQKGMVDKDVDVADDVANGDQPEQSTLDTASKETVDSLKQVDENRGRAVGVGAMGYINACSGVVHVHPFSSGPFVIRDIFVKIGDPVKKNQILATSQDVSVREVQLLESALKVKSAGLDVKKAETNLEHCGNLKNRRQQIAKFKGAISTEAVEMVQNNYDEAVIAFQKSKLALEMANAQLNLCQEAFRQAHIRAPMDGVVLGVNFTAGEKVCESGLLIMADLSELEVIAEVHEHDIFKIFKNQKAHIFLPHYPTPLMADVTYVGNIVSANSLQDSDPKGSQDLRVVEVRLKLVADSKSILEFLKINMRVDVRFLPGQEPCRALLSQQSRIISHPR